MMDGSAQTSEASSVKRSPWLRLGMWIVAIGLLIWAARDIDTVSIWRAVRRLSALQLALLTLVNLIVLLSLSGRWWVVLDGLGHRVHYVLLSAYRLAAFGLSYFTPGPQFGGEPLQIYLLRSRHEVPTPSATASVTLEKAIDLVGNFTFLLVGLVLIARLEFFDGRAGGGLIMLAAALLGVPVALLWSISRGWRPLSALMGKFPPVLTRRLSDWSRWETGVLAIEIEMTLFFREKPFHLLAAMAFSLMTWVLLVMEYWLLLRFLELRLDLVETVAVLTTARLAFLTPLPGGLGALEAGQAFAFQRLGFTLSEGLTVGLLIRTRDVIFGGVGLLLGSYFAGRGLPNVEQE